MALSRSAYIVWHVVRGVGAIAFGVVIARISPPGYHADGLSGYSVLLLLAFTAALYTLFDALRSLRRGPRGRA